MRALLFAGQGAAPSRGQVDLATQSELGRRLVDRAVRGAGFETLTDVFERGGRALERTSVLQPLLVAVCIALASAVPEPALHLGHSLGELSALAVAGSLEPVDAIDLALVRGAAMSDAARAHKGGLFALHPDDAPKALEIGGESAFLALDNAPDELVVGGSDGALRAIAREVRGRRLSVEGAWHGPPMQSAAEAFARSLAQVPVRAPARAVISSVDALPIESASRARTCLARGIVRPVRLREALASARQKGCDRFTIVGPGAALRAILRRTFGKAIEITTTETEREMGLLEESA